MFLSMRAHIASMQRMKSIYIPKNIRQCRLEIVYLHVKTCKTPSCVHDASCMQLSSTKQHVDIVALGSACMNRLHEKCETRARESVLLRSLAVLATW